MAVMALFLSFRYDFGNCLADDVHDDIRRGHERGVIDLTIAWPSRE
jgi:hypothetical protein